MGGGSEGDTHYCFKEEKKRDKRVGRKAVSRMGKMPQDLGFRGNPWSDREYGSFVKKNSGLLGVGALLSSLRNTSISYYFSLNMEVPLHIGDFSLILLFILIWHFCFERHGKS